MVAKFLATRRDVYAAPGLETVNDHGGERINKKIQARLRAMCGEHADIVDRVLQARKGAARGGGAEGGVGAKREKGARKKGEPEVKTEPELKKVSQKEEAEEHVRKRIRF